MSNQFTPAFSAPQGGFSLGNAPAAQPGGFSLGQPMGGAQSMAQPVSGLAQLHPFSADMGGLGHGPKFDTSLTSGVPRPAELGSGAITSVRVTSCNFCEMVEQANMGIRPFVSNVTNSQVLDKLPNFVRNQRPGANFKAESLNSIVNDIVGLSGNTLGHIPIVNGWNIKRYSFTIMAEVMRNTGNAQMYMIEGFTDTPELSIATGNVHVDPNMVLYVNNVTSFAQRANLHNGALSMVPTENFNVISHDPFQQGALIKDFVTQRPYDVANMNLGGVLVGNMSSQVIDARSSIATDPKTSSLSNNNPASYVAKIINDGLSAIENTHTDTIFNSAATRNMIDNVVEPVLADNGFLQVLGKISRDFNMAVTSFSWRDLVKLDNALSNPACPYLNVYPLTNRPGFLPGSGFMCDDINGSGHEQVFAQTIANGVADIMARCEATEVGVMASNHSGVDEVEVTGLACYDQNKTAINVDLFKMLFQANVMRMVNNNTQFSYNVLVKATLWGETFVKINLGYGTHTFLFPNFANSMYSPVLTNDKAGTLNVSRHLLSMANSINDEQFKMRQQFSSGPLAQSAI